MNAIDLKGRVAAITGGAQGIGLSVAKRFVASGAAVSLWDRDASLFDEARAELAKIDPAAKVDVQAVDQADWAGVQAATKATIANLGKIDILINNAGITGGNSPLIDYDVEVWKSVMDVNVVGVFHCCKAVVPNMIANGYGRIVNVASVAGKEGNPNASAYSASKAAVIALTKSLGKELAKEGDIAVNCVTPAAAKTRIFDQMKPEHIAYMLDKIPRGRFLQPDEAAAMIAWLSSEDNSFTTASTFDLSGGRATY